MMREDGGKIVPADSVRPSFEKGFDPDFVGGAFRHGLASLVRQRPRVVAITYSVTGQPFLENLAHPARPMAFAPRVGSLSEDERSGTSPTRLPEKVGIAGAAERYENGSYNSRDLAAGIIQAMRLASALNAGRSVWNIIES